MACNSVTVQGTGKKKTCGFFRSSEIFALKGQILFPPPPLFFKGVDSDGGEWKGIDLGEKGSLVTGWGSNGYRKKVKVTQSCPTLCDPM